MVKVEVEVEVEVKKPVDISREKVRKKKISFCIWLSQLCVRASIEP